MDCHKEERTDLLPVVCGAVELACILMDRESDMESWNIVEATRKSELDVAVEGEKHTDAGKDTMLQYDVPMENDLDMTPSGVFVQARSRHEELSYMDNIIQDHDSFPENMVILL